MRCYFRSTPGLASPHAEAGSGSTIVTANIRGKCQYIRLPDRKEKPIVSLRNPEQYIFSSSVEYLEMNEGCAQQST